MRSEVQPRSKKNEIVGIQGDELRIRIAAPPVDSAANTELIKFIAKTIKCPKSCVSITRGATSRHKVLLIESVPMETVTGKLGL